MVALSLPSKNTLYSPSILLLSWLSFLRIVHCLPLTYRKPSTLGLSLACTATLCLFLLGVSLAVPLSTESTPAKPLSPLQNHVLLFSIFHYSVLSSWIIACIPFSVMHSTWSQAPFPVSSINTCITVRPCLNFWLLWKRRHQNAGRHDNTWYHQRLTVTLGEPTSLGLHLLGWKMRILRISILPSPRKSRWDDDCRGAL